MLKDNKGNKLETGFYVGGAIYSSKEVDVYFIQVDKRESSFTAENWDGYLPIINFQETAKNFTRLKDPFVNRNFILLKSRDYRT